ncbi:hypothetical protein Glove_42g60 [Diversispora epigaea]|uniref:Uncharacterized protein n=1 Tax=Diversispora epigaea TaxID=1348612 RepID=A0A397JI54_9GLOM|nr:hypothetical protein Glove_42g60 [Diversispora epigaea]
MYLIPNQLQVLLLNYNGNEAIPMKFSGMISPLQRKPLIGHLKHLLRNVLDPKSASSTTTQLQRKRSYSDEIQRYDFSSPAKAPNWACNE